MFHRTAPNLLSYFLTFVGKVTTRAFLEWNQAVCWQKVPTHPAEITDAGRGDDVTRPGGRTRSRVLWAVSVEKQYRSINHRVDASSLRLYRRYYSRICQWALGLTIAVALLLAFVERPSSLSVTSDPRYRSPAWEPPCGFTESFEIVCLFIFTLDLAVKSYLIGWDEFRKNKWLISYTIVISISVVDWVLSISMVCDEKLRVRRLIRPFFLLQNSSLMKKTLKCIKRTLPEIARIHSRMKSGKCIFETCPLHLLPCWCCSRQRTIRTVLQSMMMTTIAACCRLRTYCLMNLMTAIIYNQFRGYLLMSVQTSIIRRRLGIRAAFQVLSCHEVENATGERVPVDAVLQVMSRIQMQRYYREAITSETRQYETEGFMNKEQFTRIFDELDKDRIKEHPSAPQYNSVVLQKLQVISSHYYFTIFGNVVALANVVCICTVLVLNSEKSTAERDNHYMEIINLCFIIYYLFEMCVKIFALSWKGYLSYRNNIFDGFLTILLLVLQIPIYVIYRLPYVHVNPSSKEIFSLWEMVRFVNMLIVFRFLRIIPDIKLMALVASTLLDLVKNLRAFAGILVVVYYVFAVFGIWLFEGAIKPPAHVSVPYKTTAMENITSNFSTDCGTYEQLGYWPNNFDDFAAAIILLYDVMIINNWQAFMDAYTRYTTEWSKIYFVCWWLTSSVMWVNLFVALILENFTYKWDRSHSCSVTDVERIRYETSVQLIFKEQVKEPTEEELLCRLRQHPHLRLHWGGT
ncbi:two pore channel protein 2 isoform X6 [Phyllopteryx taeniolatus]|uniref:two pore channel protein 2 isoform X6 n=1 Tax=Phyllopteryx taeniolatus TaxID=161469 RepID=UPI002AD27167|nr:two pore channel protein 2 isoform X6 [Phyllopteryx taeniolatus]